MQPLLAIRNVHEAKATKSETVPAKKVHARGTTKAAKKGGRS